MRNLLAAFRHSCFLALCGCLLLVQDARADLDLGELVISNLSHTVHSTPLDPNIPPSVYTQDWLIEQPLSNGGQVLPSIKANLDTEETFFLKISAPPGKKFWVHPPPGEWVYLEGGLAWEDTSASNTFNRVYGNGSLTFNDLQGTEPRSYLNATVGSPTGNSFGFPSISSGSISNDLTFTSITLTGRVAHTNLGRGITTYAPYAYSSLFLYHGAVGVSDPGPLLSLIPLEQPVNVVVPLSKALDTEGTPIVWTTIGKGFLPWSGRVLVSHDGIDAAESGTLSHNGAVTLQGKAMGPGTLSWWWKVSSETNKDHLKLFLDAVQQRRISGEVDWQQQSMHLGPGLHVLKWTYSKDASDTVGFDKGWLDQVQYVPDTGIQYSFTPAQATHGAGAVTASVAVATSPGTTWHVLCTADWIVVLSPEENHGNNTVSYALARNPSPVPRTGVLLIGGQNFSITQAGGNNGPNDYLTHREALDLGPNPYLLDAWPDCRPHRIVTHDGVDAVQIGPVSHNSTTSIHAKLFGPGTLSFWWKVSSETNLDMLKFFGPNGEEVRISGEVDWQYRSCQIPPGSNEVLWVYAKDESFSMGNDRGWLDQVRFAADTNCPVAISPSGRLHGFRGEYGVIQVQPVSDCMWAVTSSSEWIRVPLIITNTAAAIFEYQIWPNDSGQDRAGFINIGNQVYTIFQSNGVCSTQVFPLRQVYSWQRQTGIFDVVAFKGCPWTVINSNAWISIEPYEFLDPGARVTYTVRENPLLESRIGFVRVADSLLEIVQAARTNKTPAGAFIFGTNRTSSIGHSFRPPAWSGLLPATVVDYFINTTEAYGGGSRLVDLYARWDIADHFTWRLMAPVGRKFYVRAPPNRAATLQGSLFWGAHYWGSGGYDGSVSVTFEGVEGVAPNVWGEAWMEPAAYGFGVTLHSESFTTPFAFSSMNVVGTLDGQYATALGQTYQGNWDSFLQVVYETFETNDPGRFVFVDPNDPPLNLRMLSRTRTNGVTLVLQGPRLMTNIVQVSSNLIDWIPLSTNIMPATDCSTCPSFQFVDRAATNAARRFYRAVQR
ncbi:MAG: hypothetical protein JWM16_1777 [Verrucomicrobiales bacterium]|nr:hypothetical protein [Verrucomicrobiales bacterium]